MPGVRCRFGRVPPAEGHHEGSIECDRDAQQGTEVRIARPTLDPALDHSTKSGSLGKRDPGPAATLTHGPDLGTDASLKVAHSVVEIDGPLRSSDARHDRVMFIHGPSLAISCDAKVVQALNLT